MPNVKAGNAFIEFSAKTSKLDRGISRVTAKMGRLGQDVKQLSGQMLRFGVVAGAAFALAAREGIKFQRAMSETKAVTGATDDEFQALSETAKKLGRTTTFTATEAARGLTALGRAGFDTKESIEGISDALDLARVSGQDVGDIADIMVQITKAFGLGANDFTATADLITTVSNNSTAKVLDLAEALKFAGGSAAVSGISLANTAKILGLIANAGLKGSIGGTALNSTLLDLADLKVQKKISDQLNIDVAGKSVIGVARAMAEALSDLTGQEKLGVLGSIFDRRSSRVVAAIMKTTIGDTEKLDKAITTMAGAADKAARIFEDNLGGSLDLMISAVSGAAIGITEKLTPGLRTVFNLVSDNVNVFTDFIKKNGDLVKEVALGTAKFIAFSAAGLALGFTLVGLATSVTLFVTALKAIITVGAVAFSPITLALGGLLIAMLSLLDTFGIVETGFNSFVGNIRVGGLKLGTYAKTTALIWENEWTDVWETLNLSVDIFLNNVAKAISKFTTLIKIVKAAAEHGMGNELKQVIAQAVVDQRDLGRELDQDTLRRLDVTGDRRNKRADELDEKLEVIIKEDLASKSTQDKLLAPLNKLFADLEAAWKKSQKAVENAAKVTSDGGDQSGVFRGETGTGAKAATIASSDAVLGTFSGLGAAGFSDSAELKKQTTELKKQTTILNTTNTLLSRNLNLQPVM